jgi:hypothetical protein
MHICEGVHAHEVFLHAPWDCTTGSIPERRQLRVPDRDALAGAVRVRLSTPAGTTYRVEALRPVCGERTIVIRVHLVHGHGSLRLQLFRP